MSAVEEKAPEEPTGGASEEPEVLDLSPLAPTRRLVKFSPQGPIYEIQLLDDFGIETQQQLMAWGRHYQRLLSDDRELKEKDRTRLKFLLDSMFEKLLRDKGGQPLDRQELEKFTDAQRQRVVQAFTSGPLLETQEAQMEIIRRLVDRDLVSQEAVDEILDELRTEVMNRARQLTTES